MLLRTYKRSGKKNHYIPSHAVRCWQQFIFHSPSANKGQDWSQVHDKDKAILTFDSWKNWSF